MGIGVGIFLIALGAILAFAVEVQADGIDLNTVGVILMIVGAIGLAASFLFLNGTRTSARRTTVYDDEGAPRRGTVRERRVVEEDY